MLIQARRLARLTVRDGNGEDGESGDDPLHTVRSYSTWPSGTRFTG
jgi:hypothetical protein